MAEEWSPTALAADPMKLYRARRDAMHQSVNSKYFILGFISSGTYGRVYKAQAKDGGGGGGGGGMYAIKKFKPDKDVADGAYTGISQSAIREIAVRFCKLTHVPMRLMRFIAEQGIVSRERSRSS
jgi:cyclin-dependent kinase 8/11